MNTKAVRSVLLPEMIASEEKKVERGDQNCGSLNVWSAADKDLSF